MNSRIFLLLSFSLFFVIEGFGQATISSDGPVFYLNPNTSEIKNEYRRGSFIGDHYFGDRVSEELNKFEMIYTYYMPGDGAYAQDKKMIYKPEIYFVTKKIINKYQKDVKKERFTYSTGQEMAYEILTKVNLLANYHTVEVEKFLEGERDLDVKAKYLLDIKLRPMN